MVSFAEVPHDMPGLQTQSMEFLPEFKDSGFKLYGDETTYEASFNRVRDSRRPTACCPAEWRWHR